MRKLKLQVQMTLDGYISGVNGEVDWMTMNWSEDIKAYVDDLTRPVDLIILGKNLAMGFIPHWAAIAGDESHPEREAAVKYTETRKIVFSKTLRESQWKNTAVSNGDFTRTILDLKHQPGKDIIAYGGGQFVASLIREQLIDELNLFINPSIIGKGLPIFGEIREMQRLQIVEALQFDCGIVLLKYRLKQLSV